MCSYFTVLGGGEDLQWADIESSRGEYVLAHNGWVMDADPLVNFAEEGSQVHVHVHCMLYTCIYHAILYRLGTYVSYMCCDCLGCAVLLCLVVCLTLLASFFLPSFSSLIKTCTIMYIHVGI